MIFEKTHLTFTVHSMRNWGEGEEKRGGTGRERGGEKGPFNCFLFLVGRPLEYTNWAPGQEGNNNPGHELPPNQWEDCAQIRLTDSQGRWHDYPCSLAIYTYSYICQFGKSMDRFLKS